MAAVAAPAGQERDCGAAGPRQFRSAKPGTVTATARCRSNAACASCSRLRDPASAAASAGAQGCGTGTAPGTRCDTNAAAGVRGARSGFECRQP